MSWTKCPYRICTRKADDGSTYEEFMDCYKEDCPYYHSRRVSINGTRPEWFECDKLENEKYTATFGGKS